MDLGEFQVLLWTQPRNHLGIITYFHSSEGSAKEGERLLMYLSVHPEYEP